MRNMSRLGFGVLGQLQAAASGSAMAADTSALYWFEPNTGVTESGTITAWTDNTGNGIDLTDTDSGANAPPWNSTPYMAPAGGDFICSATKPTAGTVTDVLRDGGSAALFSVLYMDATDVGALYWSEFLSPGGGLSSNNQIALFWRYNAGSSDVVLRARSTAYAVQDVIDTLTDFGGQVVLLTVVMGQSTFEVFVNGTSYGTTAVTAANLPSADAYVALAGNGQGTTEPGFSYDGRMYEVFATADTTSGNLSAIESELMTKYGIT